MNASISTIDLPGGSLLPLSAARGERVRIVKGRVWLTEEGGVDDLFLGAGDELRLVGGLTVIETLAATTIRVLPSGPSTAAAPAAGVARAMKGMSRVSRWLRALRPAGAWRPAAGTPR